MKCEEAELSAYFDNELSPAEAEFVRQHLDQCPACAAELSRYRRVREALSGYAAPATLHARVTRHLERPTPSNMFGDRRSPFATLAALTCAAVAILVTLWWMRPATLQGPEMKQAQRPSGAAATPITDVNDGGDERSGDEQAPAPTDKPSPSPNVQTDLALELFGTVLGDAPQAVLKVGDDAPPRAYREGDELAPGVRLAKIQQRRVIVDDHGRERVLEMTNANAAALPDVTGVWRASFGGSDSNWRLRLKQTAHLLEATFEVHEPPATWRALDSPLRGTLSGRRAELECRPARRDGVVETITGEFSESFDAFIGRFVSVQQQAEGAPPVEPHAQEIRLTRIPDDDLEREFDFAARLEERKLELEEIASALRRFAAAHNDQYPAALDELVPDYIGDAALVRSTEDRRLDYRGGAAPALGRITEIQRRLLERPLSRETLLAVESDLRVLWGSNTPNAEPVLVAQYADPEQWFYVDRPGKVRVPSDPVKSPFAQGAPESSLSSEQVFAMIESDWNNLKQLGVLLKMFASESEGFLPGGWLTTYPEYLTHPEVLRSPWDPPRTLSYELLFPAWHVEELHALALELADSGAIEYRIYPHEGGQAARAKLESVIPVVIGKREAPARPGEAARRHVLFLDGHIEALLPEAWERQVAPFLR